MMLAMITAKITPRPRNDRRASAYAAMLSIASVRIVSAIATTVLLANASAMFAVRLVVSAATKLTIVISCGSMWTGSRIISGSGLSEVVAIQASGTSQSTARISRPPVSAIVP